jgi:CcmD family protein
MEDLEYFLAAYITVWVIIFAYILRVSLIQRSLRREIDTLREEIKERQRD